MLNGDRGRQQLVDATTRDDCMDACKYNLAAAPERRLSLASPVPFLGAVMTAPVVLLMTHPALDTRVTPENYSFQRPGWPLAALHPDAPKGLWEWWQYRLAPLMED